MGIRVWVAVWGCSCSGRFHRPHPRRSGARQRAGAPRSTVKLTAPLMLAGGGATPTLCEDTQRAGFAALPPWPLSQWTAAPLIQGKFCLKCPSSKGHPHPHPTPPPPLRTHAHTHTHRRSTNRSRAAPRGRPRSRTSPSSPGSPARALDLGPLTGACAARRRRLTRALDRGPSKAQGAGARQPSEGPRLGALARG